MVGFLVNNRSFEIILVSITKHTYASGESGWFEIRPGASLSWTRNGWEENTIKNKDDTKKTAMWVNRGSPAMVNFDGFDKDLAIFNDMKSPYVCVVKNKSEEPIWHCIHGPWYKLEAGKQDNWTQKSGWNTVAFKNENDTARQGMYVDLDGAMPTIEFFGLGKEIIVHRPTGEYIQEEHWAEALRLAERNQYAQSSRASTEGGITPSINKVDTLERMTGGNKTSIGDHNQIMQLICLIEHLKYALADPAVVVSVDSVWMKVAAYTSEFDAIVVLGFPTPAIDLVAPHKKRPVVGQRLIAISNFPIRDAAHQGTVVDIKQGPKTLNKYYNFQPLVAQFVSDDSQEAIWEKRISEVEEALWGTTWEYWLEWKRTKGENYFRSGTTSKVQAGQISLHHGFDDTPPPVYTPYT